MSDWLSNSELVAGMVLKCVFDPENHKVTKVSPNAVRGELFYPPYDELIADIKNGKSKEDIVSKHFSSFQASLSAVNSLNGAGADTNWTGILEKSAADYQAGRRLEKIAQKLQEGDFDDWAEVSNIAQAAQLHQNLELYTPLADIDRKVVPFTLTGYIPIDAHLLGIPSVGITLLFGPKKSGKTTLVLQIAGSFVKKHPNKKVAFHSMEMLEGYLAARLDDVITLTEEEQSRILIRDQMETPEEVINRASTIDDLGLIIIDFADLMIRGETTESSMGHIYRTLSAGSKLLRLPIILLAHPNRTYQGGMPKPEMVRWSGLASNLSEMILATYNPEKNMSYAYDKEDDKILTPVPGTSFIIAWEIRSGFRVHEEDSPGAIQVPFRGSKGWHPSSCRWMQIKE
jgi:hypothetical protein